MRLRKLVVIIIVTSIFVVWWGLKVSALSLGKTIRHTYIVHGQGKVVTLEGQRESHEMRASGSAELIQKLKLKPNTRYTLHLWGRQNKSSNALRAYLGKDGYSFYDPTGRWNEYIAYFQTGTSVEEHTELRILTKTPIRLILDDVTFTDAEGKNLIVNGQFEEDADSNGIPDGWQFASSGDFTIRYEDWSKKYLGRPDARMKYSQYKKAWISPDIASPLFLEVEYDYKGLSAEQRPLGLKAVLELPKGVEVAGYTSGHWGSLQLRPKLRKKDITRDGKPYVRYQVAALVTREQLFLPGNGGIVWFLKTSQQEGEITAYFHLETIGRDLQISSRQKEVILPLEVVRIKQATQPKKLFAGLCLSSRYFDCYPGLIEDLRYLGVNLLDYTPDLSKPPQQIQERLSAFRKAGIDLTSMTTIFKYRHSRKKEKAEDAWGIGLDGSKDSGVACASYRGKTFQESVAETAKVVGQGINCIVFDDECHPNCFCDRCMKEWEKFRQEKYPALSKVSPKVFAKDKGKYSQHTEALKDFRAWQYGKCVEAFRKGLQEHLRKSKKGTPEDIKMVDCVFHGKSTLPFLDYSNTMAYINYESLWSPRKLGDKVAERSVPGHLNYALLCSGLVYEGLDNNGLDPHEINKYQILETVMSGSRKGFSFYASSCDDLLDWKYMAEAVNILAKVEDIIIDGKITNRAEIGASAGHVRTLEKGSEALILAAEYFTYENLPMDIEVIFKPKEEVKVIDVETGKQVAVISPNKPSFEVQLTRDRARLLYVGKRNIR